MNIDVKRLADAGVAPGGHTLRGDEAFECPQQVAGLRLVFSFTAEEVADTAEGMSVTLFLTRDEAHAFGQALVECVCDG